jgi:hypothetical protein
MWQRGGFVERASGSRELDSRCNGIPDGRGPLFRVRRTCFSVKTELWCPWRPQTVLHVLRIQTTAAATRRAAAVVGVAVGRGAGRAEVLCGTARGKGMVLPVWIALCGIRTVPVLRLAAVAASAADSWRALTFAVLALCMHERSLGCGQGYGTFASRQNGDALEKKKNLRHYDFQLLWRTGFFDRWSVVQPSRPISQQSQMCQRVLGWCPKYSAPRKYSIQIFNPIQGIQGKSAPPNREYFRTRPYFAFDRAFAHLSGAFWAS